MGPPLSPAPNKEHPFGLGQASGRIVDGKDQFLFLMGQFYKHFYKCIFTLREMYGNVFIQKINNNKKSYMNL